MLKSCSNSVELVWKKIQTTAVILEASLPRYKLFAKSGESALSSEVSLVEQHPISSNLRI